MHPENGKLRVRNQTRNNDDDDDVVAGRAERPDEGDKA
jgi:hypothetical protein